MKFIGFFEYCAEDADKVIEKFKQISAERQKGTERFAKMIFGPFNFSGETKGFGIVETDDPDKLSNIGIFYLPEVKCNFLPIEDSSKTIELYLKMKKK